MDPRFGAGTWVPSMLDYISSSMLWTGSWISLKEGSEAYLHCGDESTCCSSCKLSETALLKKHVMDLGAVI